MPIRQVSARTSRVRPTRRSNPASTDPARRRFLFALGVERRRAPRSRRPVRCPPPRTRRRPRRPDQDAAYRESEHVRDYLPHDPNLGFSRRRKDHAAHQDESETSRRSRSASSPPRGSTAPDDGSADVFEALGPRCRGRGVREPAALWRDRQGRRGKRRRDAKTRSQAHRLHALLGRLLGRRDRRERRVDAAGAGVRFAAQPRRALREGRVGPRARHARALASAEDADEARQRQVAEDHRGTRRSTRSATSCSRSQQGIGPRRGVLGRQLEAQQRAGVPAAQVRVVLRARTTAITRRGSATRRRSPA